MKPAIILAALVLAACNTAAPRERIVTKTVSVPISTPCKVSLPEPEPLAGRTIELNSPIFELVQALLTDRQVLLAERETARAALEACK